MAASIRLRSDQGEGVTAVPSAATEPTLRIKFLGPGADDLDVGASVGKERTWHRRGAVLSALLMTLAVPALAAAPSPEDTIAAIEAEEEAAAVWMDSRTAAYAGFLSNAPTSSEATAERDRAILEMYSRAFQTQLTVYGLMAQHPADSEVAAAGQEAISAAYEVAAEESQMTRELYDEFVAALAAVTTTTTTLLADLPPVTTTSTTLPGLPTTSTTNPDDTTTTTDGPATPPGTSTSTTMAAEPGAPSGPTSTTLPTLPASGSVTPTVDGPEAGFGNLSTSELAIRLIGDPVPVGLERANPEDGAYGDQGLGFRVIRGLIRLSLPAAITEPLVDVALLLRAVVAAFLSGMATLAWPAGTLSGSLLLYGIWRRVRRI
jgi:hypothetical protein